MFIGLGSAVAGNFVAVSGGSSGNPNVVSSSTNGNFPDNILAGDIIFTALSSSGLVVAAIDFISVDAGTLGGINYNFAYKVADGTETGSMGNTASSQGSLVLRNVDEATLIVAVDEITWPGLTGLTAGSTIIAMGYTDDGSGNYGGATIGSGFTTYQSADTSVIAVKDTVESGTSFTFTGFTNSGLYKMCYSIGIA